MGTIYIRILGQRQVLIHISQLSFWELPSTMSKAQKQSPELTINEQGKKETKYLLFPAIFLIDIKPQYPYIDCADVLVGNLP